MQGRHKKSLTLEGRGMENVGKHCAEGRIIMIVIVCDMDGGKNQEYFDTSIDR